MVNFSNYVVKPLRVTEKERFHLVPRQGLVSTFTWRMYLADAKFIVQKSIIRSPTVTLGTFLIAIAIC